MSQLITLILSSKKYRQPEAWNNIQFLYGIPWRQ